MRGFHYLIGLLFTLTYTCQLSFGQIAFWNDFFGGSGFDVGMELIVRPDGSLVAAGEVYSTDGVAQANHSADGDWHVFKYSTQGVTFWQLTLGGSGSEQLADMQETRDGGYILIGTTNSSDGDVSVNHGQMDIWVVKLDDLGNLLWEKTFGGRGNDRGFAVMETSEGDFLIGGTSGSLDGTMESPHHGGLDSWIARLNPEGELIWERHYGGSFNEKVNALVEVPGQGYLSVHATDSEDGDVEMSRGKNDAWLVFINAFGDIQWQVALGGNDNDEIHEMLLDPQGNLLMVGTTFSTNGDIPHQYGKGDIWVLKLDTLGRLLWSKTFGGSKADGGNSIVPTHDGGMLVGGVVRSRDGDIDQNNGYYDAWAMKLDALGNKVWGRTFGFEGKDFFNSVYEIDKGGFLALGFSEQTPDGTQLPGHRGGTDIWICNFSDPKRRGVRPYITPPALLGKVMDKATQQPLQAQITLTDNLSLDSLGSVRTNRRNGEYMILLPTRGLNSINVLAPNYMFYGEDIRMDTVISRMSLEKDIELEPIKVGSKLILDKIYFNSGEWDLLYSSYAELERLLAFLNLNPRVSIEISGHTDNTGNKAQKEELSLLRANAVKEYLMNKGIEEYRLKVKGYGMYRPIAPNTTEAGRRKNRRVEFEVIDM